MTTIVEGADRFERKRREIVAAARDRFIAYGFAGTGMEMIARDATVSTATLYAHFPSKSELFREMIEEAVREMAPDLTTAPAGADARSSLTEFAVTYGEFLSDPMVRALFRLIVSERKRFDSTARTFSEHARRTFGEALIGRLRSLAATGEIVLRHPAWAAGQLLGMIEHAALVIPMIEGDDFALERSVRECCEDAVETFLARYRAEARQRVYG
jgi:AcrR family transcriptional regulator